MKETLTKEQMIEKLKTEGFAHVYEWTDGPNVSYEEHAHLGKVSFYVLNGNIEVIIGDKHINLQEQDRIDVPVGVPHTAKVGSTGCTFVVGEEIEGDS